MCEYLTNITQIIGEIWTILLIWITLKIATWQYQNAFYLCIVEGASLSYQSTKFGYNRKTQYGNMDKIVDWRPKMAFSLRLDLHRW